MSNGKVDHEKAASVTLNWWIEAERKGYNHIRHIEDLGDFSFLKGQWRRYLPYWEDPNFLEWETPKEQIVATHNPLYNPFLMEIVAINVERMSEAQIHDIIKAFGGGEIQATRFIDFLEYEDAFSKRIGLSHLELLGRKFLLEFDPTSDYETIVEDFAKESMANVEPIYVFTPTTSTLHKHLAKNLAIRFFLMTISTSTIQMKSKNEVVIPANNIDLILDSINDIIKAHPEANVPIVFNVLSDLLSSLGLERTFTFLRHLLQTLSSEKTTALFLLNTSAHDPKIVSRLRSMFYDQLVYRKTGLQTVKLSKIE